MGYILSLYAWLIVKFIIGVAITIIVCCAHYKYIKFIGKGNPIAAFIPFWGSYTLANTLDEDEDGNINAAGSVNVPKSAFVWIYTLRFLISFVPIIGKWVNLIISALLNFVIYSYALSILKGKERNEVMLLAIACAIVPIFPYFVFLDKEVKEVMKNEITVEQAPKKQQ